MNYSTILKHTLFLLCALGMTGVFMLLILYHAEPPVFFVLSGTMLIIILCIRRSLCTTNITVYRVENRIVAEPNPLQSPISTFIVIQQPENQYAIGYPFEKNNPIRVIV